MNSNVKTKNQIDEKKLSKSQEKIINDKAMSFLKASFKDPNLLNYKDIHKVAKEFIFNK